MKRNKKAFIILVFIVLTVFAVGTISVTYAWFLSRYEQEYTFILEAQSQVILSYEADLRFSSGEASTPANHLIPAVRSGGGAQIDDQALTSLEMFDTTKVTSAQAVSYTAKGGYWTGKGTDVGQFTFLLEGYLTTVQEANRVAGGVNDLAGSKRNELDYIVIFDYLGQKILLFHDEYYLSSTAALADLTLPEGLVGPTYLYWKLSAPGSTLVDDTHKYLLLQPNTTFEYTLYVFLAKTEKEFDPEINGKTISLKATLKVEEDDGE